MAVVPVSTTIGVAFAGEALTLEVSERGSLVLSAASVSAADGRANVQLRSLPASVMNYESHLQNCAASSDEAKAAGAFDVVADACGVPIGQVISDGLAFNSDRTLVGTTQLCLTPRPDLPQDATTYPILDVAIDRGSGKLSKPLQVTLTERTGSYCVDAQQSVSYTLVRRKSSFEADASVCPPAPPALPPARCRGSSTGATYMVSSELQAAGDVADFDDAELRTRILNTLAQSMGLGAAPRGSTLTVRAASVILTIAFPLTTMEAAEVASANLQNALSSAANVQAIFASAGISVTIEAVISAGTVTVVQHDASTDTNIALVAGAAGGGGAVFCCLTVLSFLYLRNKKRPKPHNKILAGATARVSAPVEGPVTV